MAVHVDKDHESHACIVRLSGEVDISSVPDVRRALEKVVESGWCHVVLDMADVSYVDSTALGLLVWIDRQVSPMGGRVILAAANRDVSRILELSGLVGVAPSVSTQESVDDALIGLEPIPDATVPEWTESMVLPARAESLARVRGDVCELLAEAGLREPTLFDVKVAVGEALANAVRHGSPGGEADSVQVDVSAYDDRVVVEVRDKGTGFDADGSDVGDDVFASGGRGVLFMRALMDRVDFAKDAESGGTVVTLEKRLRKRTDPVSDQEK